MSRKLLLLLCFFAGTSHLSCQTTAFFSPDDKITLHLIESIKNAKSKIYGAVYMITDKKIADALINAKNLQGVDVQIITDQSNLESPNGKAQYLKQNGIDTFVFKPLSPQYKKNYPALMHNKFAIIDNKVWTGSFNWTVSANNKNKENVTINDDPLLYKTYLDQFEKLKKQCVYHPTVTTQAVHKKRRPWYKKAIRNVDRFLRMVRHKNSHAKR